MSKIFYLNVKTQMKNISFIKILLSIFTICLTAQLNAQLSSYGMALGAHVSNISITPSSGSVSQEVEVDYGAQGGFHFGGYYRIRLGFIYFEPQIWFTHLNHVLTFQNGVGENHKASLKLNRIDFPVEFGLKIGPLFALYGPVYSIPINSPGPLDVKINNSGSWTSQLGVGLKLVGLQLTFRYEGPLTFSEVILIEGIEAEFMGASSQLIAGISVKL